MIPNNIDHSYSYGSISELVARKQTHEDLDFVARKRRDFMYVFPLGQMLQLQRCD